MAPITCQVIDRLDEPLQGVYTILECDQSGLLSSFDATSTEEGLINAWFPMSQSVDKSVDPLPVSSGDYSSCRMVFMTASHYGPNVNPWPYIQADIRLRENHDHSVRLCLGRHSYEVRVEITPCSEILPPIERCQVQNMPPAPDPPSLPSSWPSFLKEEDLAYWPASPIPAADLSALDYFNNDLEKLDGLAEFDGWAGLTREPDEKNDPDYCLPSPAMESEASGVGYDPTFPHSDPVTESDPGLRADPTAQPKRRGRPRKARTGDSALGGGQKGALPKKKRGRPTKKNL
ncbi:hypothetical protein F5X97DRAFT_317519 [Nemania serpens]|nr:hypothetical protein F5X97DRAFT_317519 [Nemania serpens]